MQELPELGNRQRLDHLLRGMPQSLPGAGGAGATGEGAGHDNPDDLRCLWRAARRAARKPALLLEPLPAD